MLKIRMKTPRQQWVWDRCFHHKGSLRGASVTLKKIAKHKSTLKQEADILRLISKQLELLAAVWNNDDLKEASWLKYNND